MIYRFVVAKAVSDDAVIQEAVAMPSKSVKIELDSQNVMSVEVPLISVKASGEGDKYPYSFSRQWRQEYSRQKA